jgi:hypothetical protein
MDGWTNCCCRGQDVLTQGFTHVFSLTFASSGNLTTYTRTLLHAMRTLSYQQWNRSNMSNISRIIITYHNCQPMNINFHHMWKNDNYIHITSILMMVFVLNFSSIILQLCAQLIDWLNYSQTMSLMCNGTKNVYTITGTPIYSNNR